METLQTNKDCRVKPENDKKGEGLLIRITSDKLRLPDYMCGFYGCSRLGLVLVTLPDANNTRLPKPPFVPKSGDLIQVKIKTPDSLPKDEKSGALVVTL